MAGLTATTSLGTLTRRIIDLSLVSPADVHRHGLRTRDLSRSHPVALVEVGDGRRYVVKELQPADERSQGTPEQEQAVYAAVAAHPELREWAAGVAHLGDVGDVLVLDYRDDAETVLVRAARTGWSDGVLAEQLGAALGGWHRASRPHLRLLEDPGPHWILRALTPRRPDFLRSNQSVADLLATLEGGPLPTWLHDLGTDWRRDAAIHGDLQFDNCLVGTAGGITFVDWEFAGQGDAAWDLGALAAELMSRSPAQEAASLVPVLSGAVRLLLRAYCRSDPASRGVDELARRVLPYAGARLLLRGLQLVARPEGFPAAEVRRHVDLATAVAGTPSLAEAVVSGRWTR